MTFHHPLGRIPSAGEIVQAGYRGDVDLVEWASTCAEAALRRAAIGALLRLGTLDSRRLRNFGADSDQGVRRRAAEVAPRLPDAPDVEIMLAEMLGDHAEVAEVAAFSLGEIGSADGVSLRSDTIRSIETVAGSHDDALCREAAVAALGALHTGLPVILAACADKATVRRRAVIALAPFDGPEVEQALRTALTDRDWQVRQAAEDQLGPDEIGTEPISDGNDST